MTETREEKIDRLIKEKALGNYLILDKMKTMSAESLAYLESKGYFLITAVGGGIGVNPDYIFRRQRLLADEPKDYL